MDGKWNSGLLQEHTSQGKLSRHRLLRVNLSNLAGVVADGDASGLASANPTGILTSDGGPHFIMSARTPDESHAYGFEFFLSTLGIATPATPTYTVTVWELIGTTIRVDQTAALFPVWASLLPLAGINNSELYHTFDVNACAVRFQIQDQDPDPAANRSVIIGFCEL